MSRLFRTTNNGVLIMSDVTLGQIPGPYHKRDAIHIAVIPIEAGEVLKPGQRVVLNQYKKAIATQSRWDSTGIVDPFLDREVRKGEMFWLVLRQNTVTGMRHHWYHAEFRDHKDTPSMTPDIEAHVAFVESCADEAGLDFDELMEAVGKATTFLRSFGPTTELSAVWSFPKMNVRASSPVPARTTIL